LFTAATRNFQQKYAEKQLSVKNLHQNIVSDSYTLKKVCYKINRTISIVEVFMKYQKKIQDRNITFTVSRTIFIKKKNPPLLANVGFGALALKMLNKGSEHPTTVT
jgi:hypothetical protein